MNILLIQKDYGELMNLKKCVSSCYPDSHIHSFTDSIKALDFIDDTEIAIDLCFTTVKMEGVSGIMIVQKLRDNNLDTKIVFMSDTNEYAMDAWKLHVNDYLLEPVTMESVSRTLTSCAPCKAITNNSRMKAERSLHNEEI